MTATTASAPMPTPVVLKEPSSPMVKRRTSLKRNDSIKKLVKAVRRISGTSKSKSTSDLKSKHGGEEDAVAVVKNVVTQDKVINDTVKTLEQVKKSEDRSPSIGSSTEDEDVPSVGMTASMSFDDDAVVDDFPLESPSPARIGRKISSSALGSSTPTSLRPVEEHVEASPEPIVPWVPSMDSEEEVEDAASPVDEEEMEEVAVYPEVVEALKKKIEEETVVEEVKVEDIAPVQEVTYSKTIEEIIAPLATEDVASVENLPRGIFLEASFMVAVVTGILFWNNNAFELLGYTS